MCDGRPEHTDDVICRICMLEGHDEEDPLIAPCRCKGSIEHVHLGCLREWIRVRMHMLGKGPGSSSGSYIYRPVVCDLCKSSYATDVRLKNEDVPLVVVPYTEPPFVVLDVNQLEDHQLS